MRAPCAVCALLLALGVPAFAELLPSFYLRDRAWEATHIVVVSEGGTIDGEVTVLESWWGDLPKGTILRLPGLRAFAAEQARGISDSRGNVPENGPKAVTCARMVLFLKRDGERWLPATTWEGGLDVSVAWIESGKAYARVQVMNPGERLLIDLDMNEAAMKEKAIERASARAAANTALAKIRATDDAATRAKEALAFAAETEHYAARLEAFAIVASCGEAATPHLCAALREDAFAVIRRDVVKCLGATSGNGAGEALTALLEREARFWKEKGPGLERGWWDRRPDLREHYVVAYEALQSLQKLRYDRCKETVTEILLCWSSLPQLGEEVPQLVETCVELLRDLSSR